MDVVGNSSAASVEFAGGIPGPSDRASFFEEQARNRRATWRLAALCAITILLMGAAVGVVTVPILLILYGLSVRFAALFVPAVDVLLVPAGAYAKMLYPTTYPNVLAVRIALPLLFVSIPGIVAAILAWLFLAGLFKRHGVGAMLLSLGAREPLVSDLEEQQLTNVAAEMAIAAGVPPPQVRLLDSPVANAAVIGSSPDNATLIVPRVLLDELDRDQTQGIIGHLIGSVGNGDLRIAMLIVSVYQTAGFLILLMEIPLSASSRRAAWRIVKAALSRRDQSAEEIHLIDDMLTDRVDLGSDHDREIYAMLDASERRDVGRIRRIFYLARMGVLMPIVLAWGLARALIALFTLILLGPLIALTWRTRRYLADSTAVQLTRNPDGIARSLVWLADHGAVIPAGKWADHLFIIGPEAAKDRAETQMKLGFEGLREEYRGQSAAAGFLDRSRRALQVSRDYQREVAAQDADTFASRHGSIIGFHPPLKRRLKRLQKVGATVSFDESSKQEV